MNKVNAKGRKVFTDDKGRTFVKQGDKKVYVKKLFTPKRNAPSSPEMPELEKTELGGYKEEKMTKNSAEFDRASYETDGGDSMFYPGEIKLYENPGNVDEALWAKAKEASKAAFGEIKYPFVVWYYKHRLGGKFSRLH